MYVCESWTIKKAECWRIDAFELWCWRRLLRVPWTASRSNQSILKEINPEYPLEGLMLKLKLQYFGPWCEELTHWKRHRCLERLRAGVEGDDRGWDGWVASPTQWIWVWVSSGCWWWTGKPGVLQSMGSQSVRHDWETELNWIIANTYVTLAPGTIPSIFPLFLTKILRNTFHCYLYFNSRGKNWGTEKVKVKSLSHVRLFARLLPPLNFPG